MDIVAQAQNILDLGGPVVALLVLVSVFTLALVLYKLWQHKAAGVRRHKAIRAALARWDAGDLDGAADALSASTSYLAPVIRQAMQAPPHADRRTRLEAEAEARFERLQAGFRTLDPIAQLAPLLGLFGPVLGMLEASPALPGAGRGVGPASPAGVRWVRGLRVAATRQHAAWRPSAGRRCRPGRIGPGAQGGRPSGRPGLSGWRRGFKHAVGLGN